MFDWIINMPLICSFVSTSRPSFLICKIELFVTSIECEIAIEKTWICSSRVFINLLFPWFAQSLWKIFDVWLSYIWLSYLTIFWYSHCSVIMTMFSLTCIWRNHNYFVLRNMYKWWNIYFLNNPTFKKIMITVGFLYLLSFNRPGLVRRMFRACSGFGMMPAAEWLAGQWSLLLSQMFFSPTLYRVLNIPLLKLVLH